MAVAQAGRKRREKSREQYKPKTFSLPESQLRWIRRLQAAALNDDFKLQENTVVREAMDRLMDVGAWPELKARLIERTQREPRPGRPKAL